MQDPKFTPANATSAAWPLAAAASDPLADTQPGVRHSSGAELLPEIADWLDRWQGPAPATAAHTTPADGTGASPAPDAGAPLPTLPGTGAGMDLAQQWEQLYPALRRTAMRLMASERSGHTLSPTALVNEAWLKLGARDRPVQNQPHALALATRAMRHVLVNHAQARLAAKRPGPAAHFTLSLAEQVPAHQARPDELLSLDQALRQLADEDHRAAQVAELKAFGGLAVHEIANALGVSEPTVKRDWVFARARLAQLLR